MPTATPDLISRWREHLEAERGFSPATVATYLRAVRRLEASAAARSADLADLSVEDLHGFLAGLAEDELAFTSRRSYWYAVRGLLRFLGREGLGRDRSDMIDAPRATPRRLPRYFTPLEIAMVLRRIDGEEPRDLRDRALLEVLYASGCRISEACRLRASDVDLEAGLARVIGKGDKERLVPLGQPARDAIMRWLPVRARIAGDRPELFVSLCGRRLARQVAGAMVRRRGNAVLLDLHPHSLRHACATHLLEGGADLATIGVILGHASLETTAWYVTTTADHLRGAQDLHPRT